MVRALFLASAALLGAGVVEEYQSAKRKALLIETDKVPPQGSVFFTPGEVNAYAAEEARREVPDGLRNPKITLGAGTARGTALIDFAKVQTARGEPPGLLLGWLLRGERQVTVDVAFQSSHGTARVDVQSVTVGSATLSGRALDLVIEYYVMPRFPDAAIGRPFELRHNIRQVGIRELLLLLGRLQSRASAPGRPIALGKQPN
jgi:hypothetical protein